MTMLRDGLAYGQQLVLKDGLAYGQQLVGRWRSMLRDEVGRRGMEEQLKVTCVGTADRG